MKEFNYVVHDELGIHARPAGLLVKEAALYPCSIYLCRDGKEVDAKRIFGVMSLAVKYGQEVTVKADGEQEEEAVSALKKLFEENL